MRSVRRDRGSWEEVPCNDSHGCNYGYDSTIVQKGVVQNDDAVQSDGVVQKDGAAQKGGVAHTHRVWRPNIVTEEVPVNVWRNETSEEEYNYSVCVYTQEERQRTVRVCDYERDTPEVVQREVTVSVCRMVPRTITCRVPTSCGGCGGCGY
jgi:hypothetical protein